MKWFYSEQGSVEFREPLKNRPEFLECFAKKVLEPRFREKLRFHFIDKLEIIAKIHHYRYLPRAQTSA